MIKKIGSLILMKMAFIIWLIVSSWKIFLISLRALLNRYLRMGFEIYLVFYVYY